VMIQLYTQGVGGHSMFGFGYQIANGHDYVDVYDTWDDQKETMLWGGTYGPSPTEQMQMIAVTEFIPTGGSPVPLPSTALLLAPGLISLAVMRKRLKS